jgi:hypothetical protein
LPQPTATKLLVNPEPLRLPAEAFATVTDMAATIMRLLGRLDEPSPRLAGSDLQTRLALARLEAERNEIDADRDHRPRDLRRLEGALRKLADRLAAAGDPSASNAWLSLARTTRYQSGRRDDTLSALIEALYWDRGNDQAWSELVDYASAAPCVQMLLTLFAHVPSLGRPGVLGQLVVISEGHDRLGRLHPVAGARLRAGLLDIAESQGDRATVAALMGYMRFSCTSRDRVLICPQSGRFQNCRGL